MKYVKTEDAVGSVLCHDITQIIRGKTKGPVFRKGHVVQEEDIDILLSVGKEHLYIWEDDGNMLHENEAAEVLCRLCKGAHIASTEPKEGKIEFLAECDGLFKVDTERLYAVNSFGDTTISTRHGNFPVRKGDRLGGTRVIPLIIGKDKMEQVAALVGDEPILNILPIRPKDAGIVTTGNEVFSGRIADTFTPVVEQKLAEYGSRVISHTYSDDQNESIEAAIRAQLDAGCDIVLCTGGMSVDPDDKTPLAIRNICGSVVTYGAPVMPGSMFLLAYYENGEKKIPILGLPGCVMYMRRTIFDLILPRVLADETLTREDFDRLGQGGFCLDCKTCTFPNCGFGK